MTSTSSMLNLGKVFVLMVLVGLVLAQLGVNNSNIPRIEKVHAVTRSITLVGSYNGWNVSGTKNPAITVTHGDSVNLMLSSVDVSHLFFVDVNNNTIADCTSGPDKCSSSFGPSSPTPFSFTIDFAPGTYTYYCQYHPSNMHGSFIVQGPPPAPDFSMSISPATQSIAAGATSTITLTVQSLNSFAGAVTVTPSIMPNSPSISANPTSVSLSAGGSGTSTITVTTSSSSGLYSSPTPNGSYNVTVTGMSGTITHSKTASVVVGPQGSTNPTNNSMDPVLLGGIVGAILIVIIAAVGIYIIRRRPHK